MCIRDRGSDLCVLLLDFTILLQVYHHHLGNIGKRVCKKVRILPGGGGPAPVGTPALAACMHRACRTSDTLARCHR